MLAPPASGWTGRAAHARGHAPPAAARRHSPHGSRLARTVRCPPSCAGPALPRRAPPRRAVSPCRFFCAFPTATVHDLHCPVADSRSGLNHSGCVYCRTSGRTGASSLRHSSRDAVLPPGRLHEAIANSVNKNWKKIKVFLGNRCQQVSRIHSMVPDHFCWHRK